MLATLYALDGEWSRRSVLGNEAERAGGGLPCGERMRRST